MLAQPRVVGVIRVRATNHQQQGSHDDGGNFNAPHSAGSVVDRRHIESDVARPLSSGDHEFSDNSSVNDDDDEDTTLVFRRKLQEWAVNSKSTHAAVTSLLGVLRSHTCFSSLPSSARALLQTPRSSGVSQRSGGKYRHFGVEAGVRKVLQDFPELPAELSLTFNIDGLELCKSKRTTFWVILGRVNDVQEPFVVSVFFGHSKPSDANDLLSGFVDEMKVLLDDGITVGSQTLPVMLHALVCDAPCQSVCFVHKRPSRFLQLLKVHCERGT
ncbi:hypothetical protein HPB48_017256 [Haemaphysalis longicornis]|uniref:Uncharacterized protein n=1 Tax=Haemaphysalis longicornis TaxID=44386 RepID=A0A9J6GKR5_HAELO|nr:hypothetical protein HPB48_017256 [Haemaphysalis longicornis]